MGPDDYERLIDVIVSSTHFQGRKAFLLFMSSLDANERKSVTTICRSQCYPPSNTRLGKMISNLSPRFRVQLLHLCQQPLTSGLILSLVLASPMSKKEIGQMYRESFIKEMKTMESIRRPCTLDFSVFFGNYESQIHQTISPNPRMAKLINRRIDDWKASIANTLLFPKVSRKTVSKSTSNLLKATYREYVPNDEKIGITAIDLERVYHIYGDEIEGPCEMRQKWYTSNLKPRTYYAQGGDAYRTSKYLSYALTDLCDFLDCTNRRSRVDPSRIVIRNETDDVIYYDLTSFTSNLHVQREFVDMLASYCIGTSIYILDSCSGIIKQDLGDMIYTYTRTNLTQPGYTTPEKYGDSNTVHHHNIAGFLGVYGNMATATFLHGAVISMKHDYLDENNVAGDDGAEVTDDVKHSLDFVSTMGQVADEKTFRDSEGCCIHLKRPITRVGNRLIMGSLIPWPTLEQGQKMIDDRYPYMRNMSKKDRMDAIAGGITSFLRNLELRVLSLEDTEIIDKYLTHVYNEYSLPREGCVPQVHASPFGFVPAYEKRYIGQDPITNTIKRTYTNTAKVPLRLRIEFDRQMLDDTSFRCNRNKLLGHLEILGYIEQKKVDMIVHGESGLKCLIQEYLKPEPRVYDYTIKYKLPDWVPDILDF